MVADTRELDIFVQPIFSNVYNEDLLYPSLRMFLHARSYVHVKLWPKYNELTNIALGSSEVCKAAWYVHIVTAPQEAAAWHGLPHVQEYGAQGTWHGLSMRVGLTLSCLFLPLPRQMLAGQRQTLTSR